MLAVELVALLIVAFYVGVRARTETDVPHFFVGLACLSAAAWLAEETCIRLYGFYAYDPGWSLFLGHVPVLVIIIWPVIIQSASDLARQLVKSKKGGESVLAAAVVFTDAALVEPVAVDAGLWFWSEPGLFHVPPIVPFGWSAFAGFSAWTSRKTAPWRSPFFTDLPVIVLPVVGTHLILLMMWWSIFRWVSTPIHPIYGVIIAWTTTLYLLMRIRSNQTGKRVENGTLLLRLPGAVFFFALLALRGGGSLWLPLYALAFAPPYLALLAQPYDPPSDHPS